MLSIDVTEEHFAKLKEQFDPVFEELKHKICAYNKNCDQDLLQRAYDFGLWAHRTQHRFSGEPYFEHCLQVAHILADMRMDAVTIAAGLLHDVVEDTGFTLQDIEEEFGEQVALLVDGVTKITELSGRKNLSYEVRQAETFRKMLLSMAKDLRVIIIKLADRLHNMRTLQHVPAKNRLRIALETRDVYAPLAHRFGMHKVKSELEDLAFKYLENKQFVDLVRRLNQKKDEREAYIQNIIEPIKKELEAHQIKAEVYGRPKHLYSIYRKMKLRNKPLEEIYDLFAIRIIVEKVEECYYVLGLVHNLFTPVYERFKDYIAMPKFNGYQSLHTTIVDKNGHMVEIQIRTFEMHRIAEMGIAAHWRYKEGVADKNAVEFDSQVQWVRQLLEQYEGSSTSSAHEFLESLKINLYQDEVFVFTPKGDVIRLPVGATPVDFAFAVHTNIGMHCIGAKVNGRIVPLKYELKSGDLVEIITSSNQHPNQDWLTFVKTAKARHHIRKYLREVQFEHSVRLGEEIITKYFKKYGLKAGEQTLNRIARELMYDDDRQLKAAVGRGEVSIDKVLSFVLDEKPKEEKASIIKRIFRGKKRSSIIVDGIDNVVTHLGKCCQPVPGDDIIGYMSSGKGITVHRANCPELQKLVHRKDRTVPVYWSAEAEAKFHVQLAIFGEDRKNLLRDITQAIANSNTNIIHVDLRVKDRIAEGKLIIEVQNLPHLTRVINTISKVRGILSVERVEPASKKRKLKSDEI